MIMREDNTNELVIGSSDFGSLLLRGCDGAPVELRVESITDGGDNDYRARVVDNPPCEDGYTLVYSTQHWLWIYDDTGLVVTIQPRDPDETVSVWQSRENSLDIIICAKGGVRTMSEQAEAYFARQVRSFLEVNPEELRGDDGSSDHWTLVETRYCGGLDHYRTSLELSWSEYADYTLQVVFQDEGMDYGWLRCVWNGRVVQEVSISKGKADAWRSFAQKFLKN